MTVQERLGNIPNGFQGDFKRVLCVCTAGMLRSATAAVVLSTEPYNHNTRAVGVDTAALIQVDQALLAWSEEIVCMESGHEKRLHWMLKKFGYDRPIVRLDIPDNFAYRDPELMNLIRSRYDERQSE